MYYRRKLTAFLSVIVSIIFVLSSFMEIKAYADDDHTAVNDVRNSICVVFSLLEDTTTGECYSAGYGTGFFVGESGKNPEYLLTNYHVIADFVNYGRGEKVAITLADGYKVYVKDIVRVYYSASDYEEAYVMAYDEVKDMALLRLNAPTSKRKPVVLSEPSDDIVGSTIYCLGYPGISDNDYMLATTRWDVADASITKGIISRLLTKSGTGVRVIQTDAQISHGNSGGPMVKSNGSVIGVNSWGVNLDGETENYALSMTEIIPMLKSNNVGYMYEGDTVIPSGSSDSASTGDKNTSDNAQKGNTNTSVTQNEENGINKWLIIGFGGAGVLIIIIVLIIVLSSKKKGKNNVVNQVVETNNPKTVQPMLRSMSSQHNGNSYPIGSTPALIGRDSSNCTICFREGTAGVSGRHCSVSFDPGTKDFLVTDLRSTYGTYLTNGTRLNPNVPYRMKSGESFYVGDKANIIRVELV